MAAYQAALAGVTARPAVEIGASRTKPGTVDAAVVGYYTSLTFRALAPGTQSDAPRGSMNVSAPTTAQKRIRDPAAEVYRSHTIANEADRRAQSAEGLSRAAGLRCGRRLPRRQPGGRRQTRQARSQKSSRMDRRRNRAV